MFSFRKITRRLCGAVLGLMVAVQAGQAMAACTQADAAGSWQVYSFGYQRGYEPYWVRCDLQVKPNGVFDNSTSACSNSNGGSANTFGFVRLIGTQGCIFNGYIYVGGTRSDITRATMNRSKDHVDGVGTFPGGLFFFNMTKP